MLTTFKAVAKKLPEGMQVETQARGFKILIDEPPELGGTDKGMNPVEVILCALGACHAIVAFSFAKNHDIDLLDFYVELEGDLDPDGFMGLADVRNGYQEIRYKMYFKTDAPKDKVEQFSEFIKNHCPVGDTINNPVKLVRSGVVIEQ